MVWLNDDASVRTPAASSFFDSFVVHSLLVVRSVFVLTSSDRNTMCNARANAEFEEIAQEWKAQLPMRLSS